MDQTPPVSTDLPASRPSRRGFLYGGVALAAATAGAGLAWWRSGRETGLAAQAVPDSLWTNSFGTPAGTTLSMQGLRGKPLLINFWATWCPPCVEELPMIDAFFRQNTSKSWQVIGLAIDQPSAVRSFLGRVPVSFPVGFAGLDGTELGKALGNTEGGLPFTVAIGAGGQLLGRKMGRLTARDLSGWARSATGTASST
jgi:thiol-disulfide isomerase/thioredoxin